MWFSLHSLECFRAVAHDMATRLSQPPHRMFAMDSMKITSRFGTLSFLSTCRHCGHFGVGSCRIVRVHFLHTVWIFSHTIWGHISDPKSLDRICMQIWQRYCVSSHVGTLMCFAVEFKFHYHTMQNTLLALLQFYLFTTRAMIQDGESPLEAPFGIVRLDMLLPHTR